MKVKNDNVLWLYNPTTADVHLSDLGVKIPAGKAANIYKINPYLTSMQVVQSRELGSLAKRLEAGVLKVVHRDVTSKSEVISKIKESRETNIKAIKTKSSVVITSDEDEEGSDGEFDFADYGINDLGAVEQVKQEDGTIVVNAEQDEEGEPDPGIQLKPELESGISKQSQVVMKAAQDAMTDPTGPIADASASSKEKPFTVVKPPKGNTPSGLDVEQDESGAVLVSNPKEAKPARSIRQVKKAQEEGTDDYTLPGDDAEGADTVIEFEESEYDSKVATQLEDGSVVMKLKEEEEDSKPKPKAVAKKSRKNK